jgi:hypothetical protein
LNNLKVLPGKMLFSYKGKKENMIVEKASRWQQDWDKLGQSLT